MIFSPHHAFRTDRGGRQEIQGDMPVPGGAGFRTGAGEGRNAETDRPTQRAAERKGKG